MVNVTRYARIASRAVRGPNAGRWVAVAVLGLASVVSPLTPPAAEAGQQWQVKVGAQSRGEGIQVLAFYPAEITVNAGDTISFKFATGEHHTVTFGTLPPPPAKPAGAPPNWPGPAFLWAPPAAGSPVPNGSVFVNSGMRDDKDPAFNVTFNTVGDVAYRCLLHPLQTGTVHVQAAGTPYPHDQGWYDRQTSSVWNDVLARGRALLQQLLSAGLADRTHDRVAAGAGDGVVAVDRFVPETIRVPVNTEVVWTNPDPVTPHTVTFGPTPLDPLPTTAPPPNYYPSNQWPATLRELAYLRQVGTDGPQHATIATSPGQTPTINSAIIGGSARPGAPPPPTQFTVKFTVPGIYTYTCLLHDEFGMVGKVVVTPGGSRGDRDR